jgi:hypothetical protein
MESGRRLAVTVLMLIVLAGGAASAATTTSKVSAALTALHAEHTAHAARASGLPFTSSNPLLRVIQERVVIKAVADGDAGALKAALAALGMQNAAVFGRVISGEFPIAAIPALDGVASLRFARPSMAMRRTGSVTSQGDQAMRADLARGAFGVTGAGVQVGVLSDSFDCLNGAAKDVASNDLSPVTVLQGQENSNCSGATDEGRAMLQIIHDVAPGASLSFASAFNGEAAFANNILALKANGAKVIVDDIAYLDEPMFQDGIIAQAVDTVVSQGVAYFSAAGNDGRQSYESAFRSGASFKDGDIPSAPEAPHFVGGTAHNFAPSGPADHMQRITIPSGRTLTLTFQWDSPAFSSGGPGSPNDVDIYLLNAAGDTVVAGSTDPNIGGDPVEIIFKFTNEGPTADFNLMILLFEGPAPTFIKYIVLTPGIIIQEFDTRSSTVFGHPNAGGAEAVGAAAWFQTPAFDVNPPLLEPFSSAGGTPIFFDEGGTRLGSTIVRQKPTIVAPDGGNTTFFGLEIPQDPDTFPNFFGTSAAAPHAAAVAALLLHKQPGLSPAAIYSTLESTAINMGPVGFDFDSGFGLIQADAALAFLSNPHISLGLSLNRHAASPGDLVEVNVSVANGGAVAAQDVYFVIFVPPVLSASLGCSNNDAVIFLADAFRSTAIRCVQTAPPQTFPPLARNVSFPGALPPVTLPKILSFGWPGGLPPGSYTFAIFTTPPNAFADGNIRTADITAGGVAILEGKQ